MAEHGVKVAAKKSAEQLITENLDIWTSAIEQKSASSRGSSKKFSLHGIKKLRELILELAVRGKLVPQDEKDEPASVLLARIAAEKAQLVKDKKIKKPKALPEINEDEKPFDLPHGWEWTRFGACVEINSGNSFTKTEELNEGQYIYCKVGDMNLHGNETSITTSNSFINPNDKQLKSLILSGSIIFPKRGGAIATNKKRYVNKDIFADSNVMAVKPFPGASVEYVMLWLSSFDLASLNTGTSVPQINNKDIEPLIFTVPPLEEQHRIVAKVDELMSLCDALEAQTEASLVAHQTLVETLLGALLLPSSSANSLEPVESPEQHFRESWQRVAEHFDTLFTTSASIDTLKQTILQLAVMGKLVPQDTNDEPAAKLLERIAAEKEQLIRDKKIKKQKPLPAITDEEKPFELPNGWEWTRLQDIIQISSGKNLTSKNMVQDGGIPVYGGNGITGHHDTYNVSSPTLVIGRVGFYCGSVHITPALAWVTDNAFITRFNEDSLFIEFLHWLFKATDLSKNDNATAQPVISGSKVYPIVIAMPPTEEQYRIVTKVNELMALCDQLKTRLADAQTTQFHLTDSIVEQAV